jgi:serine/threonine protein kinase
MAAQPTAAPVAPVTAAGTDAGTSCLADFEFVGRIGSGSFGTVHKVRRKGASWLELAMPCVPVLTYMTYAAADNNMYVIKQVKILVMSRKEQEAAINEVRILASLDSPYVIKYFDSFIDADSLNIVMELAEHGNLSQWLKVLDCASICCDCGYVSVSRPVATGRICLFVTAYASMCGAAAAGTDGA